MTSAPAPSPTQAPFSWEESATTFHSSSVAACVVGFSSLAAALLAFVWYYRHRAVLRTPMNDAMAYSIVCGGLGSLNAAVSGLMRLMSPESGMRGYCDVSAIMVQLFTFPAGIGLSVYFLTVVHEIKFGKMDFDRVYKLIGFCVAFGVVSAAVMYSAVPFNDAWGCRMAPTNQPWCWMPTQRQDGSLAIGYLVGSIFLAQIWYLFALVTGVLCLYYVRRSWQKVASGRSLPTIFYARVLYLTFYLIVWITAELSNMFPDFSILEAIFAPSVPFVDAIVFYWSERALVASSGSGDGEDAQRKRPEEDERLVDQPPADEKDALETILDRNVEEYSSLNAVVQRLHESRAALKIEYDPETQEWLVDGQTQGKDIQDMPAYLAETLATLRTPNFSKRSLSLMLSFLAGYCDCCGFLTLELFTAHVTGNFCTIGMSLANHAPVALKAAGLGVFVMFVMIGRQITQLPAHVAPRVMMMIQSLLLLLSWIFSKSMGYAEGTPGAFHTGLTMVSAMALQNVFQRHYLVGLPMTTLMTGNTTSIFLDVFAWSSKDARQRILNNAVAAIAFLSGCALVTVFYMYADNWIFFPPPLVCLLALALSWRDLHGPVKKAV